MNALRMLYDDLPAVISIPKNVQHTHAEVVIMVLSTPAIPVNTNKKQQIRTCCFCHKITFFPSGVLLRFAIIY